jgi:solute carrier family 35 protein E3
MVGLLISRMLGVYQPKELSHAQVFPISLAFCIHIVFNNLSLQYNSVGFYQVMKVLTSPCTAFVQVGHIPLCAMHRIYECHHFVCPPANPF